MVINVKLLTERSEKDPYIYCITKVEIFSIECMKVFDQFRESVNNHVSLTSDRSICLPLTIFKCLYLPPRLSPSRKGLFYIGV